ncbi:MAG TPA: ABC transporter permease [Streptosporangiaceae bacterium]|jgi:spermidine/putrescine transport system permease protein|nr:ABC transporter permease [Streptosporangiaceae bacterium]
MSEKLSERQQVDRRGEREAPTAASKRPRTPLAWWRNPWRRPRILATATWVYIAWSLLPVLIAIAIAFNSGRSNSVWQGFSLQWWWGHPKYDPSGALFVSPELRAALIQSLRLSFITMFVAVPLGVLFAIGISRWRGPAPAGANFLMLFSFVIPEIIIGISMFIFFTYTLKFVHLGTSAQLLSLVTYQISYPVIIVRARLLSIGKEYEEAATDLGASPTQAVRRVLLPMLYPAILVSFAIVFADTIDDFITVRYLSGGASTEPLSVKIYNFSRGSLTPAVNAAATFLLLSTLAVALIGVFLYRRFSKGQRGQTQEMTGYLS